MINVERSDGGQTSGPPTLILGGGGLVKCTFLALFKTPRVAATEAKGWAALRTHPYRWYYTTDRLYGRWMAPGDKNRINVPFFLSDGPF